MYLKIGRMKIALIIIFKIIVTKRLQTEKKTPAEYNKLLKLDFLVALRTFFFVL